MMLSSLRSFDRRQSRKGLGGLCLALCLLVSVSSGSSVRAEVDFARDIQPILNSKCTECHGGVKAAGDVSFVYEERVVNFEGKSGNLVVNPGDAEASELFYRISTDDTDELMPPAKDHAPLSKDEIALIQQWIQEGAKWSGHWAFIPPTKPELPKTAFDGQAQGEGAIDRLLFARLEREKLKPSPLEEPGRLLRRLNLGLIGLPPTLKEIEAFEAAYAKDRKSAVESKVDELLASPAFGERWASMWLDLVRYADSGGLGQDQKRTIWTYRDWVIRSFNEDLPFSDFTVKQLAGDLLPQPSIDDLVATACHRNTQTNDEGGTDDETFRVEAVVDRINTTWQTWGSITFGCVQCHDHPYDPLRHTEYYTFMDFFNNSADSDLPNEAPLLKVPSDPKQYAKAAELRSKVLDLRKKVWQVGQDLSADTKWQFARELKVASNNSAKYEVVARPDRAEFHTVGTVPTGVETRIQAEASNFPAEPVTALQLTVLPHDPKTSLHSPEWGFLINRLEAWVVNKDGEKVPIKFRWAVPDVPSMPTDPLKEIHPTGAGWGADSRIHHARQLALVPDKPITIPEDARIDLHVLCKKTGHGHPMVIKRGHLASTADPRWKELGAADSDAANWRQEASVAFNELNGIKGVTVPVMHERSGTVERPTHVFVRGNALDKDEQVASGLPASLVKVAMPAKLAEKNDAPLNRLDMAQWWVSDSHPLTARVFVNRLWEQLFGVGIVPTLEDFGSSGEKPTHPELLDYLAVRFQEDHQWSVKAILREIVLTHAFQQSSKTNAVLVERDPDNRLLARGPRLRLSAEAVRDQALSVSGLLSSRMGGAPVHPPLPEGVWRPFQGGDKWNTPKVGDENRYRRSIYTYTKRSIPFPTFAMFDAPSREFCNPRRLKSNTPLQALATLNDPAFVECSEALGRRLETEFKGTRKEKIAAAHLLVTGREASSARIAKLAALQESALKQYASLSEDQRSAAAWAVVAQVLLNLDETLTF